MRFFSFILLCVCLLPSLAWPLDVGPKLRVIASIPPIYMLVSEVMKGGDGPSILVPPGHSPHSYQLRPSDFRLVASADLLFWVGPSLENFLPKVIGGVPHIRAVDLLNVPQIHHLPQRVAGREVVRSLGFDHQGHQHHESDPHTHYGMSGGTVDPHIWLDPRNAAILVDHIAQVLSEEDPAHADRYRANAAAFIDRLQILEHDLHVDLAPMRTHPVLIFHDALQYFADRFGLESVTSLVGNPSLPPGAKDVRTVRQYIDEHEIPCFFTEPSFRSKVVDALVRETGVRRHILDVLGVREVGGDIPHSYEDLLRNISKTLLSCGESKK